jgi:hypothetical protein
VRVVARHLFGKTLKSAFQERIVEERVDGMFTPIDLVLLVVAVVVSAFYVAFYVFVLRRGRSEDRRCPGCDFLVNAKDVGSYGYVCPDCRTDWRVHPLKNDDGEKVLDEGPDEGRKSEERRSKRFRKRLVR